MTEEQLREIEAREAAATPGPWVLQDTEGCRGYQELHTTDENTIRRITNEEYCDPSVPPFPSEPLDISFGQFISAEFYTDRQIAPNAEFITHAREDIPALVAEVRRLREALEFYADKLNWRTTSEGFAAQYDRESPAAVKDGGIHARLALMSQLGGQKD